MRSRPAALPATYRTAGPPGVFPRRQPAELICDTAQRRGRRRRRRRRRRRAIGGEKGAHAHGITHSLALDVRL